MKNYKLLTVTGIGIASLLCGWLPASADSTYNGASVYRDADTIYKVGLTPNSDIPLSYNRAIITKTVYSDACGFLKLNFNDSNPPTGSDLTINGASIGGFSLTLISDKNPKYKCINSTPVFTNFTTTSESFYFSRPGTSGAPGTSTIYINNKWTIGGANKPIIVSEVSIKKKVVKANSCGFVAVKALPHAPFASINSATEGSIEIGNTSHFFSRLPVNPNPPICLDHQTFIPSTSSTTYNGANLYRTMKAVYYVGLTPNSLNTVELTGLASKNVSYYKGDPQADGYTPMAACGVFYIDFGKKRVSHLKIGTTDYPASATTTATALGCSASDLAALTPNTLYNFSTLNNGASSSFVYRVADITQKKLTVEYPTTVTRNLPVNACGFSKIDSLNKANGFDATDKVKINGTEYTISSLPLAPTAPMCKNGVTYQVEP